MVLVEVLRVAGVVLGLYGATLAVPGAARRVRHDFATMYRKLWAWIWPRRPAAVHSGSAVPRLSIGTLGAFGESRLPSRLEGDVADQIEQLRTYANGLSGRISAVQLDMAKQINEIERAQQEAQADHADFIKEQEAARKQADQDTLTINARGLPLIGISILLSGLPDRWVGIPWVAWVLLGLAALLLFITLLRQLRPGLVDT